jgi:hypothetical protein
MEISGLKKNLSQRILNNWAERNKKHVERPAPNNLLMLNTNKYLEMYIDNALCQMHKLQVSLNLLLLLLSLFLLLLFLPHLSVYNVILFYLLLSQ